MMPVLDHASHHGSSNGSCGCHDHHSANGTSGTSGCCGSHANGQAEPALVELGLPQTKPYSAPRQHCTGMPFRPTEKYPQGLLVGLDDAPTTVKAAGVEPV